MSQECLFCGGDASAPDHLKHCDGRQGRVEAAVEAERVLDPVEAARVTEIGVATSRDHAPESWRDDKQLVVRELATRQPFITSDDVWEAVGTHAMRLANPSALGSVFRSAAKAGDIELTEERRESQRPATHRRPLRVWRSLVFHKDTA